MNESDKQLRLMSAAIYEIRGLLSGFLGSGNEGESCVRLAAHLAYALHNEALAVLEGEGEFELETALARIKRAEEIVGCHFADGTGVLGVRGDA